MKSLLFCFAALFAVNIALPPEESAAAEVQSVVDQSIDQTSQAPAEFASKTAAGPVKTTLRKAALRTFLTMKATRATAAQKTAIKKVLADRELFDATYDGLESQYSSEHNGAVQDFLQWLLDNSDQIFALITKLIAMFSADDKTSAVMQEGLLGSLYAVVDDYDGTPPYILAERRSVKVHLGTCRADGTGCSVASDQTARYGLKSVRYHRVRLAARCGLGQGRVRLVLQHLLQRG